MRDPTHQLSVHVLHLSCTLVCTTIAPRVLHFSAVHYTCILTLTHVIRDHAVSLFGVFRPTLAQCTPPGTHPRGEVNVVLGGITVSLHPGCLI